MTLPKDNRKDTRVQFSRGVNVQIMAIDGTWKHSCVMLDVAESGARIEIKDPIKHLNLTEFFLILSATGDAFRRCELAWVNGGQLGLRFLAKDQPPKKSVAKVTTASRFSEV